jgi:polyphosphate kinase
MPRNLDHRVEVLMPVDGGRTRQEVTAILDSVFADNTNAWELNGDGSWHRLSPAKGERTHAHQAFLQRRVTLRARRQHEGRSRGR